MPDSSPNPYGRVDGRFDAAGVASLSTTSRAPDFDEIVNLLAPVLWFSPDEPLLLKGIDIPSAHPRVGLPEGKIRLNTARFTMEFGAGVW